jgi:NRPS condensation-like uncharacterized protein
MAVEVSIMKTIKRVGMVSIIRKLGLVEHLFETLHSMGAMLYVNIVRFQGALSYDFLRTAIDLLQKRHPLLQVYLQKSDNGLYFRADSTPIIPLKVIERQHDQQWIEIAEDELCRKFASEVEPLCRITLLQKSEKLTVNELIVTFHHAIADGISALHFIHELLSYYQQLVEGITILPMESLPLLPSLEQLLETYLAESDTQIIPSPTSQSPALIVEQIAPVCDRRTRLVTYEFNQGLTSKIKNRCRREQTTVHGALCAAMVLACVRQLSSKEPVLVACGSSVNLRASCVPAPEPNYLGCFVSSITTNHYTEQNIHFWTLARECESNVRMLNSHKVPHLLASSKELVNKYQASFLTQLSEHNMGRSNTTHVSNLGQFDFKASYGSIYLESFYFATGLNLVGTCFWLGAVTVHQKLCCTFTYVDPLISMKTAESLVDSVIMILDEAVS